MNVGIINDTSYTGSITVSNYWYAIQNLFENVKIIKSANDLNGLDILFIGNDHFGGHLGIWNNDYFINTCNNLGIKVFVHTCEYIHTKVFPWNIDIQRNIEKFHNIAQRVIDVNDAIILNKKIARCLCSKFYKDKITIPETKINKCVFIGTTYDHRVKLISDLSKKIEIDTFPKDLKSWEEYMSIIAQYRFVLSPYSTDSNTFHLKFYEALLVDSIPIHQIHENTLQHYTVEAQYDDVIYFINGEEIPEKVANCKYEKSYHKPWLEEELTNFFMEYSVIPTNIY